MVFRSKVFIDKIVIENFKSIKRLELRLKPGINLLVGPNASGKTNILEALHFLYKALVEEPARTPYTPHAPDYWSPLDLVYNRTPDNPIVYRIGMIHRRLDEKRSDVFETYVEFSVKLSVTPDAVTIYPVEMEVNYQDDTKILIEENGVEVRIRKDLYENIKDELSDEDRKMFRDAYEEDNYVIISISPRISAASPLPLRMLKIFPWPRGWMDLEGGVAYCVIHVPFLAKDIPVIYRVSRRSAELFRGYPITKPSVGGLGIILDMNGIVDVLSKVILLKHPDIGRLREPQPLQKTDRLDVRATNLVQVLYALLGSYGGLPPRISDALLKLFPGTRIKFLPQYGRVALMVEEDGLELPPPNIPDGLFKLLAILTAVELKPSLLLIDEIENSMHRRMIEYVVDTLNSLEIPVLVATHSPHVVDLVGPERTIVVSKKLGEGTVVELFENAEELRRRLDELGIAFSDYVFHAVT